MAARFPESEKLHPSLGESLEREGNDRGSRFRSVAEYYPGQFSAGGRIGADLKLAEMIRQVPEEISYISRVMAGLNPGF